MCTPIQHSQIGKLSTPGRSAHVLSQAVPPGKRKNTHFYYGLYLKELERLKESHSRWKVILGSTPCSIIPSDPGLGPEKEVKGISWWYARGHRSWVRDSHQGPGQLLRQWQGWCPKSWWVSAIYSQPFRFVVDVPRRAIFKRPAGFSRWHMKLV